MAAACHRHMSPWPIQDHHSQAQARTLHHRRTSMRSRRVLAMMEPAPSLTRHTTSSNPTKEEYKEEGGDLRDQGDFQVFPLHTPLPLSHHSTEMTDIIDTDMGIIRMPFRIRIRTALPLPHPRRRTTTTVTSTLTHRLITYQATNMSTMSMLTHMPLIIAPVAW